MHRVYIFVETNSGGYADSPSRATMEARPMAGDIYLLTSSLSLKTYGLKVDTVLCVVPEVWHVYGHKVEADWSHKPYFGVAGDEATLVAHALDQMQDFPERYREPEY